MIRPVRALRKRRVLKYVNDKRLRQGVEPLSEMPSGLLGSGNFCPLARALPGNPWVGVYSHSNGSGHGINVHPNHVQDFIDDFDAGLYPELIW